jgi:hypothetical protein
MIKLVLKYFLPLIMMCPVAGFAQKDSIVMVKFTPEFKFEDGIYLNFQQVKANSPIPKSRLLTTSSYDDKDFFDYVLDSKTLSFYDQLGVKQTVAAADIWGFCRNGILYIRLDDNYHRITIVGQICHFVATITTYDTRYYDPYYYNPYNYYNYRYGAYPTVTTNSEMRQYLLDFNTGKVMDYEISELEVLLMQDPELHDEFAALRKKKKKQQKFLYIRKFNERNPLYLPVKQIL